MEQKETLVGIHVHKYGKVGPFSQKYIKILKHNNLKLVVLDINQLDFWEQVKQCTHFIFHWGGNPDHHQIAKSIMPIIEKTLNINVFPDEVTTWHHDDKIKQYYLLLNSGLPTIKSYVFWDKKFALQWIKEKADFPKVFKLTSSAGSKDVVLVRGK
ncbi:MAG: hypothetical protein ACOCWG_03415, partial [bacterium]